MTTRRDFIRRGALWVAGAVVLEEPIKRLWAFPNNPATGLSGPQRLVWESTQHGYFHLYIPENATVQWVDIPPLPHGYKMGWVHGGGAILDVSSFR
jgi:hypothetical protein